MHYPALADRTYFNFGGQGVLSQATLFAITDGFLRVEEQGCFSYANQEWFSQEINHSKEMIAQELGVTANTISLTENTTVGCNIALWSLDWQRGDHLLISDGEHPGIVAICQEISRRCGVVIDTFPVRDLPTDQDILQSLKDHLQPQTRMVCLSHIIWNTGQVMPLQSIAQLCHKQDVLVAVDAAQSVGVLPLDLTALEIDYYAFTAHKWWCAPLGVGGLYVRPQVWEQSHATYIGWRGLEFGNRGAKFEVATSTYPLYCGLSSALAQANEWGSQSERYDRLVQMAQSLWRELQAIPRVQCLQPQPPLCGLVTFTVDGMSSATLSQALEQEHRIHVRAMAHPDCLRASVHYLNSTADLDRLLSVLQKFR